MVVFSLTTMRKFIPLDLSSYTGLVGYLGRVGEREGYKRGMERGDPDMDWRSGLSGKGPEIFEAIRLMSSGGKPASGKEGKDSKV